MLTAARASAIITMPALVTARGPKRSASMPAPAPSRKYSSPLTPNTSETSARLALKAWANGSKNAANEYETPKITAKATKVAPTTTQPYRSSGSSGMGQG